MNRQSKISTQIMSNTKPLKPIPSKANLFCFRCQVKLGKILNRGTFCPICRRKICKKCLASSNLNNSFCQNQATLSHQTLINYQLISQKFTIKNSTTDVQLDGGQSIGKPVEYTCLNNNSINLSDKNLSSKKCAKNDSADRLIDQSIDSQFNQRTFGQSIEVDTENELNRTFDDSKQVPKKSQRKNAGLYIKRATSSTADSMAARRYRANLSRSNTTTTKEQEVNCTKNLSGNKVLSMSCEELTHRQQNQQSHYSNNRSTSEQNLSHNVENDRPGDCLDEHFDKSASLPKFKSLNRLLSKLKRSHTVHNVDDIGKRSSIFNYSNVRSNSLKNQYGGGHKSNTLWRRSSAKTIAIGQQIYMKTLNLGKKGLFKRHSSQSIPICKLKGICSFCCKKITSESFTLSQTIGYSFNRAIGQIENQTNNETNSQIHAQNTQVVPIPPARKSTLVKSNSQKDKTIKLPIKAERQFIVQRCVLEQSSSMGELNVKQLDQISDQDSGLQTNSLEGLDQKSNPRKNHRATTLPKTTSMLFGMPLDSEKRGTLKVRSHIEMNEDGTFYVQDSDWEMTSESDHWHKSDQFSSISSTELNELSCEYFRLNSNLCKDKLLKELSKDMEMDKSDTLCSRNMKQKNKCLFSSINDVNRMECEAKVCSTDTKDDECETNDRCRERTNSSAKLQVEHSTEEKQLNQVDLKGELNEANEEQSNDTLIKLDDDQVAISESKRDQNQLMEENKRKLDTFINLNNETTMRAESNQSIKMNRTSNRSMYRASSVGENMNENDSKLNRLLTGKHIKRSFSETVLHFNDDDVNSADDELDEDEDDLNYKQTTTNKSADPLSNESRQLIVENESNESSNLTTISYNNSSSTYCLDTYSFKKEQCSRMPDQGVDFFSSDEQSIEQNQLNTRQSLLNEPQIQSPMLAQSNDATQTEDDKSEDNEECTGEDLIDEEILNNYSSYQRTEINSVDQPDFESNDFENDLINHDRLIQQRHHITSLENLFSLETIQEQDEEDYSLKDQLSLRSNQSQRPQSSQQKSEQTIKSEEHESDEESNRRTSDDVSNIKYDSESNVNNSPVLNEQIEHVDKLDTLINESGDEVLNSEQIEQTELGDESMISQISMTRSQNTEELIENIYRKVCLDEEDESTSQDYKKFRTFRRDSSVENDVSMKATDLDSLDDDHFNSLSECTIDENVTIEDQQILISKNDSTRALNLSRFDRTSISSSRDSKKINSIRSINQATRKEQVNKPEICKRNSLINKNLEQLDKSKKKINEMLKINIEPRTRVSNTSTSNNLTSAQLNTVSYLSTKSNLRKGELNESGVHMDQIDELRKKSPEQDSSSFKVIKSSIKSSHLYLDGSSGVDSGPSSGENNRNEIESTKLVKLTKDNRTRNETENVTGNVTGNRLSPTQLLKSRSMYNVDQQFKRNEIAEHRLSSEEFNRRRRSYEVNLDTIAHESNKSSLNNLRRKSTNYLLNQSFNQLSNEDITRIKRELIRRSEERLARFESSMSSRSNSNMNSVNNSVIESMQNSKGDDMDTNRLTSDSLENRNKVIEKRSNVSSDENLNEYEHKRISRKELNEKWRDTLKRSDSLDSINSIKSMNSLGSLTNDELANMKVISRTRIKSINQLDYREQTSEDEYDYSTNDDHVLKNRLTTDGELRLIDNLIHCRSKMEEQIGERGDRLSYRTIGLYTNDVDKPMNSEQNTGKESNREADNDYDELVENSYVEMSLMSNNGSAINHTYKMISERENPYEFDSNDSFDDLQDENSPFSLRDDCSIKNEYENLQMIKHDHLSQLDDSLMEEEENVYQNLKFRSTDHLKHYSNKIQRRETFNQSCQLNQVKLPLKRSKSVPGNTLTTNLKYLKNKSTMNDKLSQSRTSPIKIGQSNDDSILFDQLNWQKKHLHHLHKQHWNFRLRNAEDEITDYTSLFTLDQQNLNRPYELLIASEYKETKKEIHLFIKECRNFGNLTDKFIKVYLLPDKQSKQRTSLQSKTIGHVNNLIERKSFSICSPVINKKFVFQCERFDNSTNSRTIFISVWKNRKSLLEKNQCLGELFLKVRNDTTGEIEKCEEDSSANQSITNSNFKFDLEDSSSNLSFNWLSLDQSFNYSGDLVFSILYEANKNQLQLEVIECLNLLNRKRDLRTLNTYCKVELKRLNESSTDHNSTDAQIIEREIEEKSRLTENDTNNNSKENEKQVRFLFDDTLDSECIESFTVIDSQKTVIIKNSLCPKYNKLFIFNDISSEHLKQYGLELTVWCQSLAPHCLGVVRLGCLSDRRTRANEFEMTSIENCIKEEQSIWKQLLDKTRSNSSITASLQLRPID